MIEARDLYERYRLRERERTPADSPIAVLLETARFSAFDPREYDETIVRNLQSRGLIDVRTVHLERLGRVEVGYLTYHGKHIVRQNAGHEIMLPPPPRREYLEHDLAVHRMFREHKRGIERSDGEVVQVVTEHEFKSRLGRVTVRNPRAEIAVREFAEEHHLRVVEGRIRIPDCRIVYLEYRDYGDLLRRDLEIASGHGSAAKARAGMIVQPR